MGLDRFRCRRCGKCCKERWEIAVDFEKDILRWLEQRRFDILKHLVLNPKYLLDPARFDFQPQWMINTGHVLFGDKENRCPFLQDASEIGPARCRIQETWPQVCQRFPYDEKDEVRTDILDICMGSIFYHSNASENVGVPLHEYMRLKEVNTPIHTSLPREEELQHIAQRFREGHLKICFTSEPGLVIAEEMLDRANRSHLVSHQKAV